MNIQLERLRLSYLQLQHICREGCKMDPILEVLEYLYVTECANLKTLVPPSVTFPNLTYLEITNCNGLINLIYSSTATSMVNLQGITLKECKSLEEIVTQVMDKERDDIVFKSMRTLTLECLPRLNSFSYSHCFFRFPLLKKVVVRQCARMKTFCEGATSTPMLRKVILKQGKDEEWCWEGDLNRTTKKIYVDKVAFRNFDYLELSEYPELKELWYGSVGQKTFCNLKHLVVRKCTFLSNMLFSSNLLQLLITLEELEVAECDSMEAIFDVKTLDEKAIMESKKVSGLKKLTLSKLPNLKHIWSREAEEVISFGKLHIVKVDKCQHLKYLFSVSLCLDLRQLEELHIESCGVQKIVSFKEGPEELELDFPLLTNLQLLNLTELTNFCPKRYTLECPSLKNLNVRGCEELQIFAFDDLNPQSLDDIDLQMKQALFNIEKLSQNLEELPLNEKDIMSILNGNYDTNLFKNIKRLRLQQFQETPIKFVNALIQIFPATITLQVRCSSFKALFPSEEIGHCSIESPNQIKTLWLYQLEQLELIWRDDDTASHPLIQNLEDLFIIKCSRLIRLAPRFATFKNLASLEVKDCNGLMYLMTSYTAKSLVHLTSLEVRNCGMLEEVVMTDEGESKEDITFESLEYLELNGLPSLKSFYSGKCTFIFPSLVTLEVTGCHKIQSFSYGVIIAPFLKLVEVENGRKRWKEDLNTTIKQLFIDKAIGGVEGDYEASSSSIDIQNGQFHQIIVSTSRALTSEEHGAKSKAGSDTQKISEITEIPLEEANQDTKSLSKIYSATGTEEMNEGVESTVNKTSVEETAVDSSPLQSQQFVTSSIQNEDAGTKEMHETIQRPLVQNFEDVLIAAPSIQDIAIGSASLQASKASASSKTPVEDFCNSLKELDISESYDSDIHLSKILFEHTTTSMAIGNKENVGTQETYVSKRKLLSHDGQTVMNPTMDYGTETNEATDKSFSQKPQAQSHTKTLDIEALHDTKAYPSETLFNQPTTFVIGVKKQTSGSQKISDTIQTDLDTESLPTTQYTEGPRDSSIGTQEMCCTIKKPYVPSSTMISNAAVGTQDTHESKMFSVHDAKNVFSPTVVYNRVIDPPPSQASEASSSSTTLAADFCSIFKDLDISIKLLPYLEAGVKQHPQVLHWHNTNRQRKFASLYFSIFAEVTRILMTTPRNHSTEDDQNYIKECCTVLKGVGFDESWVNYVHGRIEECGDGEDIIKREVEEAEGQASNLKAQIESMKKELASMEESLALFRDKAQGFMISSSPEVRGFSWRSTFKNSFIFIAIYLLMCVLIYGLSTLPS